MSITTFLLALAAAVAGFAAGWLHFASLGQVAEMIVAGRLTAIWLQLGRLAALAAFLFLCAQGGAPVLIAAAAGLLAGRAFVLRRARP